DGWSPATRAGMTVARETNVRSSRAYRSIAARMDRVSGAAADGDGGAVLQGGAARCRTACGGSVRGKPARCGGEELDVFVPGAVSRFAVVSRVAGAGGRGGRSAGSHDRRAEDRQGRGGGAVSRHRLGEGLWRGRGH